MPISAVGIVAIVILPSSRTLRTLKGGFTGVAIEAVGSRKHIANGISFSWYIHLRHLRIQWFLSSLGD
jgi:hypothetical protein